MNSICQSSRAFSGPFERLTIFRAKPISLFSGFLCATSVCSLCLCVCGDSRYNNHRVAEVAQRRTPGSLQIVITCRLGLVQDLLNFQPPQTRRHGPFNGVAPFVTEDGGTDRRQDRNLSFGKICLGWKHE